MSSQWAYPDRHIPAWPCGSHRKGMMPSAYHGLSQMCPWQFLRGAQAQTPPPEPHLVPCATLLQGQERHRAGPGCPALRCLLTCFRLLQQPGGKPKDNKALWKVPSFARSSVSGKKRLSHSLPGLESLCRPQVSSPMAAAPLPSALGSDSVKSLETIARTCLSPPQPVQLMPARDGADF